MQEKENFMQKYIAELIGTMFLVMSVGFTGNPFAIGIMLMVMIYASGHISGGHLNPAVTLGVFLRGKMESKDVAPYMVSQVVGAVVGAYVVYLLTGRTFSPTPGESVEAWKALIAEFLFTFALVTVVLNVATAKKMEGNFIYGLAIGFTVLTSAFCVGNISGGAFNPAVAMGPTLINAAFGNGTFSFLWIYLVGCFSGGAAAAYMFKFLNQES